MATPIGNLGDMSPRAQAVLRDADLVVCEDTRVTGKLLRLLGISRRLTAYHEHNAAAMRPRLIARLRAGAVVALASDAGTPLVSDPGYKLVRAAIEARVETIAVPGPSAALAALVVSGLPSDRFLVAGFLPSRAAARRHAIAELAPVPATLVLFESGRRLVATLTDLTTGLGAREAAVARELTKHFEEVRRGTLAELRDHYAKASSPRGELALVVGPPLDQTPTDTDAAVDAALALALEGMSPAAAATAVASATGRPRRELYRRLLALRQQP